MQIREKINQLYRLESSNTGPREAYTAVQRLCARESSENPGWTEGRCLFRNLAAGSTLENDLVEQKKLLFGRGSVAPSSVIHTML